MAEHSAIGSSRAKTAASLQKRLDQRGPVRLLDVRAESEAEQWRIDGGAISEPGHIPTEDGTLTDRPPRPANHESAIDMNMGRSDVDPERRLAMELGPDNCTTSEGTLDGVVSGAATSRAAGSFETAEQSRDDGTRAASSEPPQDRVDH